jgi:hypothetical protein
MTLVSDENDAARSVEFRVVVSLQIVVLIVVVRDVVIGALQCRLISSVDRRASILQNLLETGLNNEKLD